jgi:hypothetical protein
MPGVGAESLGLISCRCVRSSLPQSRSSRTGDGVGGGGQQSANSAHAGVAASQLGIGSLCGDVGPSFAPLICKTMANLARLAWSDPRLHIYDVGPQGIASYTCNRRLVAAVVSSL